MATYAQFIVQLEAAVTALVPGIVRSESDYRTDLGKMAPGENRWQLRPTPTGHDEEQSSNDKFLALEVDLFFYHRLADRSNERAYTQGDRLVHWTSLCDPGWWRAMDTIRTLEELGAELPADAREGDILEYQISATLILNA